MESWGYVKLSRKAYATDPLWLEARQFSKWEAWEDMIQMAAFRKHSRTIGAEVIALHRGEFVASLRYLAARWKWTIKAVRGFLEIMERTERIRARRGAQHGTVYVLTNYHAYQTTGTAKGTARGKARAHPGHTKGTKEKAGKKGRRDLENYSLEFEEAWTCYPRRLGGNSKLAAFRQWQARLAEGVPVETLVSGTKRYALESQDKVGTPYIKLGQTFYGRDRHFEYEEDRRVTRDDAVRRAFRAGLRVVDESRIPVHGFAGPEQCAAWIQRELERQAAA